ncbi:hypothetical protein [Kitasatospora xanthocidica]|uniref:hypothetical protein n=1 Tax=Kitasatospora xanthocidica TaxID=83382 RepID=UPI0011C3DC2E|nr:hypothetical protein [Kitasatospora xanthocidica]
MKVYLGNTSFELDEGRTYISIWYPWTPDKGDPVRPLHSGEFAKESDRACGSRQRYPDWTEDEFRSYCREMVQRKPYLDPLGEIK